MTLACRKDLNCKTAGNSKIQRKKQEPNGIVTSLNNAKQHNEKMARTLVCVYTQNPNNKENFLDSIMFISTNQ